MDIHHLAALTGISLTAERTEKLSHQLENIIDMLDKVKSIHIEKPSHSRHELLQMQAKISDEKSSSALPVVESDALLANVQHPLVGHAIVIKGFVE